MACAVGRCRRRAIAVAGDIYDALHVTPSRADTGGSVTSNPTLAASHQHCIALRAVTQSSLLAGFEFILLPDDKSGSRLTELSGCARVTLLRALPEVTLRMDTQLRACLGARAAELGSNVHGHCTGRPVDVLSWKIAELSTAILALPEGSTRRQRCHFDKSNPLCMIPYLADLFQLLHFHVVLLMVKRS